MDGSFRIFALNSLDDFVLLASRRKYATETNMRVRV